MKHVSNGLALALLTACGGDVTPRLQPGVLPEWASETLRRDEAHCTSLPEWRERDRGLVAATDLFETMPDGSGGLSGTFMRRLLPGRGSNLQEACEIWTDITATTGPSEFAAGSFGMEVTHVMAQSDCPESIGGPPATFLFRELEELLFLVPSGEAYEVQLPNGRTIGIADPDSRWRWVSTPSTCVWPPTFAP